MFTLLKILTVQNTSSSSLVGFVRDTTLVINSLPSQKYEEFCFKVIMFFSHPEVSQQPASLSEVGHSHQTYGGHAGRNQSPTTIHVNIVDKTGCSKGKLKFPCKLREGDHLNH